MRTRRLFALAAVLGLLAALMPSAAGAALATSTTVVVKPSAMHGWFFWDDTTDSLLTATGNFTAGPASAPLGTGSAHLTVASLTDRQALITPVTGFNFADLSTLTYSTYRSSADAGNNLAISLQFTIDYSPTDLNTGYQGRLVFEPSNGAGGTVVANTWQTWNALNGQWWASKTTSGGSNGLCPQLSPCTWSQMLTNWPNARINPVAPAVVLKAGGGWSVFDGNVDNLTIGVSGNTTTYDFEPETPCTTVCYVDAATGNDAFGGDTPTSAKKTIQAAVNQVSSGGTVHVAAGTYVENVIVGKAMTIQGAGQGSTIVEPAVSGPAPTGCGGSPLCAGGSTVFLIAADNVHIAGLTVEGANPSLALSGLIRGGVAVNARNGIITDLNSVIASNNLVVDNVTVQDIYLRGIEVRGTGFDLRHDTVTNVQGDVNYSVAMFNTGGSGTFANDTVSLTPDAINSNHSKGTQVLDNVVSDSGSGVHTDNAGDGGGTADRISGNTVSNCTPGGPPSAVGIWTFVPYIAPTVTNNTVTNCAIGLGAFGQGTTAGTTSFTGNRVNGGGAGIGAYISGEDLGYGPFAVSATLTGNTFVDSATGVQVFEVSGYPASAVIHYNVIAGNPTMGLTTNSVGSVDATNNWWGCSGGPADTANCNGVSGNVNANPWLVDRITVAPIAINATGTMTADFTYNSNSVQPGGTVPDGTTVHFTATGGTIATPSTTTLGGHASASIVAGSTVDVFTACAQAPELYGAVECTPYAVYDPSAGFVTGAGWITSPGGACQQLSICQDVTGKANFAFVSKYQKGATVPTGHTAFVFKAGGLDFQSTSYQWLVIAGSKAQFKGVGSINGAGTYTFMIKAVDNGSSGDTFRIQIWDSNGLTVYDNHTDTLLGGGSIVIHS